MRNHDCTQAGNVLVFWFEFFLIAQPCDVGKCWCGCKSAMTLLLAKIILRERPNGSLVKGGTERWLLFSQQALTAAECRATREATLHLSLRFIFCRAGGAVGWKWVCAQSMWEELWSISYRKQWMVTSGRSGACSAFIQMLQCFAHHFRQPVYSREMQHDPGTLMSILTGTVRRMPAALSWRQKDLACLS